MVESCFYHINEPGKLVCVNTLEEALIKAKSGSFIWLAYCQPTKEELSLLIEPLGIHPLAVEDCLDEDQIPKIEDYPNNTHILFNSFSYANKDLIIDEINFFIGSNFLITVNKLDKNNQNYHEGIKRLVEQDLVSAKQGPAYLMHTILDNIVDNKFSVLESIEDELISAEDAMADNLADFNPAELQRIRRDVLALRKSLFHEREILIKICRKDIVFIPEKAIFHYRDIYDHLTKFFELSEKHREIVTSLTQMNLSLLNNKMAQAANQTNKSVRRLTLITTIFMPLTLIAGIGGMSEWSMMTGPENWRTAYPAFLLAMAIAGGANYFLLKWLEMRDQGRE